MFVVPPAACQANDSRLFTGRPGRTTISKEESWSRPLSNGTGPGCGWGEDGLPHPLIVISLALSMALEADTLERRGGDTSSWDGGTTTIRIIHLPPEFIDIDRSVLAC